MPDSESPATLFELLYAFLPKDKGIRISYDNGCNFLTYALNRDPVWAASVRVFIDALHFKGHVGCASSFSTGVSQPATCAHVGNYMWLFEAIAASL